MKSGPVLVLLALFVSPAAAQNAPYPAFNTRPPGLKYEDCVAGCKKCGSGQNPDCILNFCSGLPRRKPSDPPVPINCPNYD
jgi:hypothetical protein